MQSLSDNPDPRTAMGTREHAAMLTEGRHPAVRDALQWLTYSHLPHQLRRYSAPFYLAAADLLTEIASDSPELTTALNGIVYAKDSAVRAGIKDSTGRAGSVPRPQTVVEPPLFEHETAKAERETSSGTSGGFAAGRASIPMPVPRPLERDQEPPVWPPVHNSEDGA